MNYKVNLNSRDLDNLASSLLNYSKSFEEKVRIFLERLAQEGIEVASVNGGDFSSYIVYSKKWDNNTTIRVSAHSRPIISDWYSSSTSKTARTEEIVPILMAEFGSGHHAISGEGEAQGLGGQGTLNVYGHANDSDGWYWWSDTQPKEVDANYVKTAKSGRMKFHSTGYHPTQPLHKAVMACIEQVTGIAKEVFG